MKKPTTRAAEKTASRANDLKNLPLDRFSTASRAENIYEVVKAGILMGTWAPGERIDDKNLALELGVSRLSVREALSKLVEVRILEKKHWKGFQVRKLSWSDIESIIEIRQTLEVMTIRKVVRNLTPQIENALEKSLVAAEADLRNHDVASFLRSDYLFHEILYQASNNAWLADILRNLRILIDIIRSIIQSEDFEAVAQNSVKEHHDVLRALRSRDEDVTARAMNDHIANHRQRIRARIGSED